MNGITRLVYLTTAFPGKTAGSIQIARMCDAFATNGIAVELLGVFPHGTSRETLKRLYGLRNGFGLLPARGLPVLRNYDPLFRVLLLRFVRSLLKNGTRRSVILYGRSPAILPMSLVLRYKKRFGDGRFPIVLCEVHESLDKRSVNLLRYADGAIVITVSLGEELVRLGMEAKKVVIAPDAVDLEAYLPLLDLPKWEVRRSLGFSDIRKVVVFTGHLYADRGIEVLVHAVKSLDDSVIVILVGGLDRDVRRVRELVASAGLEGRVQIAGYIQPSQIPAYQVAADVLVIPYGKRWRIQRWSSPLKLFEYMASKAPIVSTDFPVLREILVNERNCLLVKPDDPLALAAAIGRVLDDSALASAMSEQAFIEVQEHTWTKRAARVLDFIREVTP